MDVNMGVDAALALRDVHLCDTDSQLSEDIIMTDIESIDSHPSLTSTTDEHDTPKHDSLLLSLPAELRQRIWYYSLHNHGQPITWPARTKSGDRLAVGLLRTCKLVHQEASPYLYENAILSFRHPSDAMMFHYNHNPTLGRRVRRLLLHVVDRDLKLWNNYLESDDPVRSLLHDYPKLTELRIVLCSTPALRHTAQDVRIAYRRWPQSTSLHRLCDSLKLFVERNLDIRIIFFRAALPDEELDLFETFPDAFEQFPRDARGPRLRTHWLNPFGIHVALDATPAENPWLTGNWF